MQVLRMKAEILARRGSSSLNRKWQEHTARGDWGLYSRGGYETPLPLRRPGRARMILHRTSTVAGASCSSTTKGPSDGAGSWCRKLGWRHRGGRSSTNPLPIFDTLRQIPPRERRLNRTWLTRAERATRSSERAGAGAAVSKAAAQSTTSVHPSRNARTQLFRGGRLLAQKPAQVYAAMSSASQFGEAGTAGRPGNEQSQLEAAGAVAALQRI